jgi:hypothetical protein
MADFLHTLVFALLTVALFWLVSQGFVYNITNGVTSSFKFPLLTNGVPNLNGVLLHGAVLAIGVLVLKALLLPCKEGFKLPEKDEDKKKKIN